jgi:aspartyl-tRNA(Asn)/glutamyl-tRNA(Gln) amidotransferase subunit A
MSKELHELPITEVSKLIKERKVSPVELTKNCLTRIEQFNGRLSAFITVYADSAIKQAKKAEREIVKKNYRGALHGVPIAVKDNIYFAKKVTTMGSKIHGKFISDVDATVVTKLSAAGAVFLGKTNMHEYALGATTDNPHYGTCRNPWHLEKIPGGSSGGSAAAVAAYLAYGALGTDTSGSIRVPAAACGLVGLKPTYGRVSKFGCFPEAWSLDHIGPLTRSVEDAAIILDVISGADSNDPTTLNLRQTKTVKNINGNLKRMTIGIEEDFFFNFTDTAVEKLVKSTINRFKSLGAKVKKVNSPSLKDAFWALTIIDTSETTAVHQPLMRNHAKDYGADVRFLIECGYFPTAVDYLQALQLRRIIQKEVTNIFEEVDVLLAPTLPIKTPSVGELTSVVNGKTVDTIESCMHNVGPGNLLGLPSISMPCGLLEGIPVGIEIIGGPLQEQKVLNLAKGLELTNPLNGNVPTAYLNSQSTDSQSASNTLRV